MKLNNLITLFILLFAGLLLIFGWQLFWFLTDDAFIAFRYVSNSILGYGYVWNPAPFRPVEGYTSFLWVLILDIIWRFLDIAPPKSSNYLTLIFSYLTLIIGSAMILKIKWNDKLWQLRHVFLALALLGIITNRTFLAWTSSGLETAMFNFFITLWVYSCLFIPILSPWWIFSITFSVAGVSLTRPDGLLFAVATIALFVIVLIKKKQTITAKDCILAFPLISIFAHLWWRKTTYGEWLPNTYYAKVTGVWPESGIRYALSFMLEYALWFWLALVMVVCLLNIVAFLRGSFRSRIHTTPLAKMYSIFNPTVESVIKALLITTLTIHVSYYTFIVGGDHFEYRAYSYLILFIFISFLWLLNKCNCTRRSSIILFVTFILLSYPVPWTHWWMSHNLKTRKETFIMKIPIAKHWPQSIQWYARAFDDLQFWLIDHSVCLRHQEHKVFHLHQKHSFPSRSEGMKVYYGNYPIAVKSSVGVLSWVYPKIFFIDRLGLNDYVIARHQRLKPDDKKMAHERRPPEGYIECFKPNVTIEFRTGRVLIYFRDKELTAEDIIQCESRWSQIVKRSGNAS